MQRDGIRMAAGWPCPSMVHAGTRDTLTQTRTHGFGLVAIKAADSNGVVSDSNNSFGAAIGDQRATSRINTNRYQGGTTSDYNTCLQGIAPKTAGKPAFASHIGVKVDQQFETGWGVGVVLRHSRPASRWPQRQPRTPSTPQKISLSLS
jgi:hypothetical protein